MSKKIGRNDPCPCGSGKKYKKCCLGKDIPYNDSHKEDKEIMPIDNIDQTTEMEKDIPLEYNEEVSQAPLNLHPYTIARMVDPPLDDVIKELSKQELQRLLERWTISKIAALTTEEICSRLLQLGIDPSKEAFLSLSVDTFSAWDIGNKWMRLMDRSQGDIHDDFVCLSACELWKRYIPERPSMEMLDDWMQEGYNYFKDHPPNRTVELWTRVWDTLRPRFTPRMRKCNDTISVFNGTQCLFNWHSDFCMALDNAAVKDPAYAALGIRYCREFLAQFPDECDLHLKNTREHIGWFLFISGQREEGEAVFQELIRDDPDSAQGYVCWADALCFRNPSRTDREHALALLEQAQARPVKDAHEWDLDYRIKDFKTEMEENSE